MGSGKIPGSPSTMPNRTSLIFPSVGMSEPVEHVAPVAVADTERGVVEVVSRIVLHAEPFHDGSRPQVHLAVNDTISERPNSAKPRFRAARAASVA